MTENSTKHGSARFAKLVDLARAGLISRRDFRRAYGRFVRLGYFGAYPIILDSDAPITTIAGSGAGKGRDVLIYTSLYSGAMLVNDPKGEIAACTLHYQITHQMPIYCINALGLHAGAPWFLPMHGINPLDILRGPSPSLVADVRLIMEMLITSSGGGSSEFFEGRARQWGGALLLWLVLTRGVVTLPELYELVNMIESSPVAWEALAAELQRFDNQEIQAAAGEMLYKRASAGGEYSGIMGTLMKGLNFLSDPALSACLSKPDFSLEALCSASMPCKVHIIVPAEYVSVWASFLRVIIGVAMLYKSRHPEAARVLFLVDEAAQLGKFDALLRAYTYGRGAGIRTWGVFQDLAQMAVYGPQAAQTFLGSSQVAQYLGGGVRDLESAMSVSRQLGQATYQYDDERQQAQARRLRRQAVYGMLTGQLDPLQAAYDARFFREEAQRKSDMPRPLMTPDEVLTMPNDRQILFVAGVNCPPIYGHKYPYFMQSVMDGAWLPNPNHPPYDSVRMAGRKRRVISEKVPDALKHWPQYQLGYWSYPSGFRPRLPWLTASKGRKIERQNQAAALPLLEGRL